MVELYKPTARQIRAARKLAGLRPISVDLAAKVAAQDLEVIEVAVARRFLEERDLKRIAGALRQSRPAESLPTPTLDELPGFVSAREWTARVCHGVKEWKAHSIPWSEVQSSALLSGPPGVGKTFFAQALASTLGFELIATSVGDWQRANDGHLGDMLKAMKASFDRARAAKGAVLLIDEMDSIGDRRRVGDKHRYYETTVVNALLEHTDGVPRLEGVILLGATNFPDHIDPALRRTGRFSTHIILALPTAEERAEIASFHVGGRIRPEEMRTVTDHFKRASASDIEDLVKRARTRARMRQAEISLEDLAAELPPGIPIPEEDSYRVGVHELGHAIVALQSGFVSSATIELESSTFKDQINNVGRTIYHMDEQVLPGERFLLSKIRIALAGMAAEEVILGERSIGSGGMIGSDLEEATNIATLMAASYGLGSFLRLDTPLTSVSVNFRPSPAIAADVESILKREYEAAKELLLIVEKDVRSLAGVLATDKRLTLQSHEVLESFKDRRP